MSFICPVLWVSWHDDILARGYADQGFLEAVLAREEWTPPDPIIFEHHEVRGDFPAVDGALVVICSRWHTSPEDVARLQVNLDRLAWSVVVLSGDEAWEFPWREIPQTARRRVWAMQPVPGHETLAGMIPGGWYPGTHHAMRAAEAEAAARPLDWMFAGQVADHVRRLEAAEVLRPLHEAAPDRSFWHETAGYLQGIPQADYWRLVASARVIPSPSGPFCLAPETPVLCADLIWRPIEDLHLGQEIIGFDEDAGVKGIGASTKYRASRVESLGKAMLDSYEVQTSMGLVTASAEHRWLVRLQRGVETRQRIREGDETQCPECGWVPGTGRDRRFPAVTQIAKSVQVHRAKVHGVLASKKKYQRTNIKRAWVRTADLHPGDRIVAFGPPWQVDDSRDAGWLAGIYDGEGSLHDLRLNVAQNKGRVLDRIDALLAERGFKTYVRAEYRCEHRTIAGGRYETLRFLGTIRPERFMPRAREAWEGSRTSFRAGGSFATVRSIRPIGPTEVITIGTSTKTLIAQGLLSHNSADTARTFEALEAGCLPVADLRKLNGDQFDYWALLFRGDYPFPAVADWAEFPGLLEWALATWPESANRCFAWWQAWKRRLALQLDGDLRAVARRPAELTEPDDMISVVVTTSPVPAHPATDDIETVIASVRAQLPQAEVIVAIDGVRLEQEDRRAGYEEYTRRLLWLCNHRWHNVVPVLLPDWRHQAGAVKAAFTLVDRPLVLMVEHDTPLVGQVDWAGLCGAVQTGQANVVRLHHETTVLDVHRSVMCDDEPRTIPGPTGTVRLRRTVAWWQRPHLAGAAFYRSRVLARFGPDDRSFIEDHMYQVVHVAWEDRGEQGWNYWRLYIYTPDGDDIKRSSHLDSRGDDPKYGQSLPARGPT